MRYGIFPIGHAALGGVWWDVVVAGELLERFGPACGQGPDFFAFHEDGDGAMEHHGSVAGDGGLGTD